jgi:hypothetical protein
VSGRDWIKRLQTIVGRHDNDQTDDGRDGDNLGSHLVLHLDYRREWLLMRGTIGSSSALRRGLATAFSEP